MRTIRYVAVTGLIAASLAVAERADAVDYCQGSVVTVNLNSAQTPTAGDDVILGTPNNDTIHGGGGNDSICGGNGNDTIYGDAGANFLDGGAGDDAMYLAGTTGTYGGGTMTGGAGYDRLDAGGVGSQFLVSYDGGDQDDLIILAPNAAGNPARPVAGGDGKDAVFANAATGPITVDLRSTNYQTLGGGLGTVSMSGVEQFSGSSYADTITGTASNSMTGMDGADTINVWPGGSAVGEVGGNGGTDTVNFLGATTGVSLNLNSLAPTVPGFGTFFLTTTEVFNLTDFADTLTASTDPSVTDPVTINAGGGADTITGGAGITYLDGGSGNDTLTGGSAPDVISGGAGDDTLGDKGGGVTMHGGPDTDTASFAAWTSGVELHAATGIGGVVDSGVTSVNFDDIEVLSGSPQADKLYGDAGNNDLRGAAGADQLYGAGGNDQLTGGPGADLLAPGGGADVIANDAVFADAAGDTIDFSDYLQGVDFTIGLCGSPQTLNATSTLTVSCNQRPAVVGSSFADHLWGSPEPETISGGDGADQINAGAGDDILDGGPGSDLVYGEQDDDTITATAGADTVFGGPGDDTLTASVWSELHGDDGDDTLTATSADGMDAYPGTGDDTMHGPLDLYYPGTAGVWFNGGVFTPQDTRGAGTDSIDHVPGVIVGGNGSDHLTGGAGTCILRGYDGNDVLDLTAANPSEDCDIPASNVEGGAGNDTVLISADQPGHGGVIDAGTGANTLSWAKSRSGVKASLASSQTIAGHSWILTGFVNLTGSKYADTLTGDARANIIDGGGGVDTVSYAAASKGVKVNLATTKQQNTKGAGRDTIRAVENVVGSKFGDILLGSAKANALYGAAGNDTLKGLAGKDLLDGGTGRDLGDGGSGRDRAIRIEKRLNIP